MKKVKQAKKTLLLNLFAGPGTGKSSTMAGVFSELKFKGVDCEQAPEFAKEKVWEGSTELLGNQIYVFGKQLHAVHRVIGKVDVVVTDSPLLFSLIYGQHECEEFRNLVTAVHKRFWTYNVFLRRHKKYNPNGRMQTEKQAKGLDKDIRKMLDDNEVKYVEYDSGKKAVKKIAQDVIKLIGEDKQEYK